MSEWRPASEPPEGWAFLDCLVIDSDETYIVAVWYGEEQIWAVDGETPIDVKWWLSLDALPVPPRSEL